MAMRASAPPIEAILAEVLRSRTFAAWVQRCAPDRLWSAALWALTYVQLEMIHGCVPIPVIDIAYDDREGWQLLVDRTSYEVPFWLYCFLCAPGCLHQTEVVARLERIDTNLRDGGMRSWHCG